MVFHILIARFDATPHDTSASCCINAPLYRACTVGAGLRRTVTMLLIFTLLAALSIVGAECVKPRETDLIGIEGASHQFDAPRNMPAPA